MLLSQRMETTGCSENDPVYAFCAQLECHIFYFLVSVLADNFAAVNGIIVIVIIIIVIIIIIIIIV